MIDVALLGKVIHIHLFLQSIFLFLLTMTKVDNFSTGFRTCVHNCHDPNDQKTRVPSARRNIHILICLYFPVKLITSLIIFSLLSSTTSGTSRLNNKHRSTPRRHIYKYGCPLDDAQIEGSWPTRDDGFLLGCLLIGRGLHMTGHYEGIRLHGWPYTPTKRCR